MTARTALFVPGLYGSTLHSERTGALRWPALSEIVFRRRSLATDNGCVLRPGRVLDRVSVLPKLYSIDVYGEAMEGLRGALGADVEWRQLAYDWRSELSTQTHLLDAAVDAERARGRRVVLVAHSLGGLLACYYLRYGTQALTHARENWGGAAKLECVALAGVPFGGSALALIDLVEGRSVAGNAQLLDAATYRSFGATWQLLPQLDAPLLSADAASMNVDLFDARDWQRLALVPADTDVTRQLRVAQRLRELLAQSAINFPARRPRLLLLQGADRPTLQRVVHQHAGDGPRLIDNLKTWRRCNASAAASHHLYGDGDGVVTREASAIPPVWNEMATLQTLVVSRGHRRLLNDRNVQQRIGAFVRNDG